MKKFVFALVALFTMTIQASAMSYEQAREQALFLTDKMAYELNLTDDQYEAAYEVNLDYLMGINDYDDLYGAYWTRRNLDLSYILLDWQYRMYLDASYFYRPLYWDGGYWHFGIYARYPHRDYYFFGRPTFYVNYRGGHSWAMNGGRSWYHGRSYGTIANGRSRMGMRDGFNRGDYGRGTRYTQGSRSFGNGGVRYDNNQQNRTRSFGNSNGNRSFGNSNGNRSFGTNNGNRSFGTSNGSRSFDNGSTSVAQQNRTRSFGSSRESSTRTTVTRPESSSRYFGNNGNSSSPSRTFTPNSSSREFAPSRSTPSRSSGSFGSSNARSYSPSPSSFGSGRSQSSPSRSFGGGNMGGTRSSGSSSNNGGGRFGGHR